MGNFDKAVEFVLQNEGGWQKNPDDPGNWRNGKLIGTKYGISAKYFPDVDIENLTVEQAKEIYHDNCWHGSICKRLPDELATVYFDAIVNMGLQRASKVLQHSCNRIVGDDCLSVDGIVGERTQEVLNMILHWTPDSFVNVFIIERIREYIYGRDATKNEMLSWIRRSIKLAD